MKYLEHKNQTLTNGDGSFFSFSIVSCRDFKLGIGYQVLRGVAILPSNYWANNVC